MGNLQLTLDLLPKNMHLIHRHSELEAHIFIVLLSEDSIFILTDVVAVERVFKSERMRNLELFPRHDSGGADFVGLDPESAVLVIEHVSLLRKYSWQQSDNSPG